jgi:hypothetical protein
MVRERRIYFSAVIQSSLITDIKKSVEKKRTLRDTAKSLILLEAATGFEPVNNGFADRCLSHLAMPPSFSGAGERI